MGLCECCGGGGARCDSVHLLPPPPPPSLGTQSSGAGIEGGKGRALIGRAALRVGSVTSRWVQGWGVRRCCGRGGGGHRGRPPTPPRSTCTSGGKRRPRRHPLPEGTSSPPQREAVAMRRTPGRTFCGCKAGPRGAGGGVQETACGAGAGGGDESGRGGGGGAVRPPRAHGRATEEVIPPPLPHREALCRWLGSGGGQPPVNTVDVPVEAPPPPNTPTGAAGRLGRRIMP